MVLEKTLESPLDCKEIQPIHSKKRRSVLSVLWKFSSVQFSCSVMSDSLLKLKLQYFGHLMRRADLLEKTDAGRDWGQEEKGTTEDEMAGCHHGLDGRECE